MGDLDQAMKNKNNTVGSNDNDTFWRNLALGFGLAIPILCLAKLVEYFSK